MNQNQKTALWSLGFRPFFLFGILWSFAVMLIWILFLSGHWKHIPYFDQVTWHAHEMIYGFVAAIIAGFLLTASQNWTGIRGVHGLKLQFIFSLWVLGRIWPFVLPEPRWLYALIDLSFFPVLAIYMLPYLGQKKQRRNQGFFVFFVLLFLGNLILHGNVLSDDALLQSRQALLLSVDTILLIIVLIAGRVIPFFTSRAVPGAKLTNRVWLNHLSILITALFLISEFFFGSALVTSLIAFLAAVIHFVRWMGWRFWQSVSVPILWILYFGYFWIIIGFAFKGLEAFLPIIPTIPTHAFTIGAMGVLIYGMVSRVSLGHTGRKIEAFPLIVLGYWLINLSVASRLFLPFLFPQYYSESIQISGWLWFAAYVILFLKFYKILILPRPDGKPG